MDTKHYFGQTDPGFFIIGCNALAAGKYEFGATAHAGAVDGGDRGTRQFCQRLVNALAVLDVFQHGVVLGVLKKCLDVGPDGKTRWLGRMDDYTGRLLDRQTFHDLLQLVKHGARNRVDVTAVAVETQRDDAIVAQAGFPVVETQSFEHKHANVSGRDWNHTVPPA